MLNYEFPPIGGGAGNAHYCILKEYAKMSDLKIDVLTSAAKPGFIEERFAENVTVYKTGLHKKRLHYWRKSEVVEWLVKARGPYRRLLNSNHYDLVHAFFGFPSGYLCYRTAGRIPYIVSLRGSDVPGQHQRLQLEYKLLAPLFKSVWQGAAALVACSEGLKRRAQRFLPSVDINVIPNGVDIERFSTIPGRRVSRPVRLITVGRLSITKRVDVLIDAVELLKERGFEARLNVVGEGSLEESLKQTVSRQGLGDTVNIAGHSEAEAMPQLYRQSDVYVSATMQEGMSNAMLEAMASGLPIVTTCCEGVEELIADNGIIVQEARPAEIADAVMQLAGDNESYARMSAAAEARARKFTWSRVAQEYLQCYEKALRCKRLSV
jgi:glycosyltransferase involved in cell wall biosynthesis